MSRLLCSYWVLALICISFTANAANTVPVECDLVPDRYPFIPSAKSFQVHCTVTNTSGGPLTLKNVSDPVGDGKQNCALVPNSVASQPIGAKAKREIVVQCSYPTATHKMFDLEWSFSSLGKPDYRAHTRSTFEIAEHPGCGEVHLDEPGGTFAEMAGLEQEMNNCQTHTALSLYDAWRFSHHGKDRRRSSPGSLYLEACASNTLFHPGDTNPAWILNYLKSHQPCALNPGELNTITRGRMSKVYKEKYEVYSKQISDAVETSPNMTSFRQKALSCARASNVPIDLKKFDLLTKTFDQPSDLSDISLYVNFKCDPKDRVEAPHPFEIKGGQYMHDVAIENAGGLTGKPDSWQNQQMREINQCLDRQRSGCQPISISYCSIAMKSEFSQAIKEGSSVSMSSCEGHVVTLIGRRFNPAKNRCEFLLRNSSSLQGAVANESWQFASGNDLWMDQTALSAATMGVVQLQERQKK